MSVNLNSERHSSTRSDNSLFSLTKRFLKLMSRSPGQSINISQAAMELNVEKRRIYDITNVLEGLGLLSKWSVNCSKWMGGDIESHIVEDFEQIDKENDNNENILISKEEIQLNEALDKVNEEIFMLSQSVDNLSNAYVTYSDLKSIPSLSDKMVFAVKAPSETSMEYPRYEKGQYKLKLISDQGAIGVYYVSDEKNI